MSKMKSRAALAGGVAAAFLAGGMLLSTPSAVSVEVPTLSDFLALEARVSALEVAASSTTTSTVPATVPTTTTTTTLPPTTTTSTTTTVPLAVLPPDGIVTCDNCSLVGQGVYPRIVIDGRENVEVTGVSVDGSLDPGGPIQSGTVQVNESRNVSIREVTVVDSPRASYSVTFSEAVVLDSVESVDSWHLGLHANDNDGLTLVRSKIVNPTLRIPTASPSQGVGWESGGMKIVRSRGVVVQDNEVYGGYGPGIWLDIWVEGARIEGNFLHDLTAEGIFVEISTDVEVLGNTVERAPNGLNASRMNWCYGGGILVSTASAVNVHGNTVDGSYHGIMVIDQSNRGDTPSGYQASDYRIAGNTVRNVNKFGACQDVGRDGVFRGEWRDNTLVNVAQKTWASPLPRPF